VITVPKSTSAAAAAAKTDSGGHRAPVHLDSRVGPFLVSIGVRPALAAGAPRSRKLVPDCAAGRQYENTPPYLSRA
jgi:hypothetical protein